MKNKSEKKRTFTALVVLEVITLIFGTFMSIAMTYPAVKYDKSLWGYLLFGLLGIIMIAVLVVLNRKKKWYAFLIGIAFIAAYLVFAGYNAIKCAMFSQKMDRIGQYDGKEITAVCDGVNYRWNGDESAFKAGFNRNNELTEIEAAPADNTQIDGEDKHFIIYKGKKEDAVYIRIYSGASEIYLELDRVES